MVGELDARVGEAEIFHCGGWIGAADPEEQLGRSVQTIGAGDVSPFARGSQCWQNGPEKGCQWCCSSQELGTLTCVNQELASATDWPAGCSGVQRRG